MAKAKTSQKLTTSFRTPVVAVLGHVDHGKTTLLDTIRGTRVAAKEAGGITQNTRAHQVETHAGRKITFIDTPGHEAFSAMRRRGAQATDFVLLVVAADDGVQPQTKESIKFAQESGTPIIIAINKIDIKGVKPDKVKQELAGYGVNIEEYGGDTMCFEISALKNTGVSELIEGIELLAEISELKPHEVRPGTLGEAYVLESASDKRLGPVALCILESGSISGRIFGVVGGEYFRVRTLMDQYQKQTAQVSESGPFWITGLETPLQTGKVIFFVDDEKMAKELSSQLALEETEQAGQEEHASDANALLLQMLTQRKAEQSGSEQKVLNLIVRASTQGTLEAVKSELEKLETEERKLNTLKAETGEVSESDIKLAKTTGAVVVSFQSELPSKISSLARQQRVLVRHYSVIYEMLDELKGALDSLTEPVEEEVEVARAKVKQVFKLTNGTIIAGCIVIKGTLIRGYKAFVERPSESDGDEIAEVGRGRITQLRIQKSEVKEVNKGQDCGIMLEPNIDALQEGDEIVAYKLEKY